MADVPMKPDPNRIFEDGSGPVRVVLALQRQGYTVAEIQRATGLTERRITSIIMCHTNRHH